VRVPQVVFGEHRYYGKTYPFGSGGPDSYSKEHIGYLSVEQALADYATLIEHLKSTLPGILSHTRFCTTRTSHTTHTHDRTCTGRLTYGLRVV
jgi:hypothetical protein